MHPIVPAIPNIPVISRPSKRVSTSALSEVVSIAIPSNADHLANAVETAAHVNVEETAKSSDSVEPEASAHAKAAPKTWADLVRNLDQSTKPGTNQTINDSTMQANGFAQAKAGTLANALSFYSVEENNKSIKTSFLEPRGLVNTGNMCYMNSVNSTFSLVFQYSLTAPLDPADPCVLCSILHFP